MHDPENLCDLFLECEPKDHPLCPNIRPTEGLSGPGVLDRCRLMVLYPERHRHEVKRIYEGMLRSPVWRRFQSELRQERKPDDLRFPPLVGNYPGTNGFPSHPPGLVAPGTCRPDHSSHPAATLTNGAGGHPCLPLQPARPHATTCFQLHNLGYSGCVHANHGPPLHVLPASNSYRHLDPLCRCLSLSAMSPTCACIHSARTGVCPVVPHAGYGGGGHVTGMVNRPTACRNPPGYSELTPAAISGSCEPTPHAARFHNVRLPTDPGPVVFQEHDGHDTAATEPSSDDKSGIINIVPYPDNGAADPEDPVSQDPCQSSLGASDIPDREFRPDPLDNSGLFLGDNFWSGSGDHPALECLGLPSFNYRAGSVMDLVFMLCDRCSNRGRFLCSGCRKVAYCSSDCQLANWEEHRLKCMM